MKTAKIKKLLTQYSHKIAKKHLIMGAMGNISLYDRGEVWIKRGGAWMERAKPSDFIKVGPRNKGLVSKEINLHLGCFRVRPDINAVIHTHPFITTAIGTILVKSGRKTPKIGLKSGLKVAIISYYKPGSRALAGVVQKAIKKANAVVMANHGLVTVGKSLKEAYQRTLVIERGADRLLRSALEELESQATRYPPSS